MSKILKLEHVSKIYHLYDSPIARLKEALHPWQKKYHKEFYALKDISLEINAGESIGIIGMNGGGKSTLLKIIAGILTPTSGKVERQGRISALLELGAGFNPEFSGIENIHFQCSLQGFNKEQTEAMLPSIVEFADIGPFIYQPVKTYSSGMYVRLAFSVAIIVDPDILIIDEALAVGDAYFQAKCIDRIRDFMSQKKTLIFVSHDPGAVKTLCNKAFLLHQGQLVDSGSPSTVFEYYNSIIAEKEKLVFSKKDHLRKRSGNKKIEIISAKITGENGKTSDSFVSGENVKITLKLKANTEVEDPTIGILIKDRLGNNIFGTNTAHMQKFIGRVHCGQEIEVNYHFKMNLGTNIYSLTVAAHTHTTHISENYDWINNILVFKVLPCGGPEFLGYCRLEPSVSYQIVE